MIIVWGNKDPNETRDYALDWSPQLGTNIISTSSWAVVKGTVVASANSHTTTGAIVRLTGGVDNEVCLLTNTVVLDDGETYEQTCQVLVQNSSEA